MDRVICSSVGLSPRVLPAWQLTALDAGLEALADDVFRHVWRVYPEVSSPVYQVQ